MGAPVELSPSWSLAQAHERPPRHPLSSSTGHLPPPPYAGKGSWLGSLQHLSCQKMKRFGELWARLHSAFEKRGGAFSPF